MMEIWAYDVEVLPNYLSVCVVDVNDYLIKCKDFDKLNVEERVKILDTVRKHTYTLFNDDDSDLLPMIKFISRDKSNLWFGFNSSKYDKLIISALLIYYKRFTKVSALIKHIHDISGKIIRCQKLNIKDNSLGLLYKYGIPYSDVDLMKVFALDKAFKSLKATSINLLWHDLLEYERPDITEEEKLYYKDRQSYSCNQLTKLIDKWDRYLIESDRPTMEHYNYNDVYIVCEIIRQNLGEIELRFNITNKYKIDVTNSSRSNIADTLFLAWYKDKTGIDIRDESGSEYRSIKLIDVVWDKIKFQTDELKLFLERLKSLVVISVEDVKQIVTIGTGEYTFATGGLHSIDKPGKFYSNDKFIYRDADVTSYYPHIIKYLKIKPRHLNFTAWFEIVEYLINERVVAKRAGDSTTAEALKIVINSIFGKLGFANGFMYDRKALLQVTLNGQLALFMLIEDLELNGFKVISANTDGIVTEIDRDRESEYQAICEKWEQYTKFNLEYANYEKYIRVNVNSYMSLKDGDKPIDKRVKYKGSMNPYLYRENLTKGFNAPIVSIAIANYYLHNKSVMNTLVECSNILLFSKTQNVNSKYEIVYKDVIKGVIVETKLQRNNRYYISNTGGSLFKVDSNTKAESSLIAGERVRLCNQLTTTPVKELDINYKYYYDEAMKLINQVELMQSTKGRGKSQLKKHFGQYLDLFD